MNRPFMPIATGDYLRGTGHLTTEQHGAYFLLQIHYWEYGSLPKNDLQLAAIARVSQKKWRNISDPIAAFFGGEWNKHQRLDQEIERVERTSTQRKISGSKGGLNSMIARARAMKFASPVAQAPINQLKTHSQSYSYSNSTNTNTNLTATEQNPEPPISEQSTSAGSKTAKETKTSQSKRPNRLSKDELDCIYKRKRGL